MSVRTPSVPRAGQRSSDSVSKKRELLQALPLPPADVTAALVGVDDDWWAAAAAVAAVRAAGYRSEDEEDEEDGSSIEEEYDEEEEIIEPAHQHQYGLAPAIPSNVTSSAPVTQLDEHTKHSEQIPSYSAPSKNSGIEIGRGGYATEKKGADKATSKASDAEGSADAAKKTHDESS